MIALGCNKVCLSFGDKVILKDVSFSVNDGDRVGIVGVNGAGKTTLVKILTRSLRADEGEVFISQNSRVGYLDQHATVDSQNTVYEEMLSNFSNLLKMEKDISNLEEEMRKEGSDNSILSARYCTLCEKYKNDGGYEFRSRVSGMLKKMGFSENMMNLSVSSLSGGQKTSLSLVGILLRDPDILILDEPTNHLDIESLRWLENYLVSINKTLIVISHDRYFLDKVTTHTLDIENTHAVMYKGSYSAFAKQKEKDKEIYRHHWENQQKEIARQEAFIEQQRRWNREKNIIAAESRLKALERMEKLAAPESEPGKISFSFGEAIRTGEDVLKVENLFKGFDTKSLFEDLSFDVKRCDRLFILGKNGCGKSTLVKILAGKIEADKGNYYFGANVKIGYYDQEYQGLSPDNTVLDEIWDEYGEKTMTEIRSALALFRFRSDDVFKKVSVLSGGEKARLTLAKLMLSKVNVLLLDEPTNHLDIASRETLEDAVLNFRGTVIAVSHDRYFISKLATRILHLEKNASMVYNGNYEEYLSKTLVVSSVFDKPSSNVGKDNWKREKEEKARERKREKDKAFCESEIERVEKEITLLDGKMQNELATDYTALVEANDKKIELERVLEELYEKLDLLGG